MLYPNSQHRMKAGDRECIFRPATSTPQMFLRPLNQGQEEETHANSSRHPFIHCAMFAGTSAEHCHGLLMQCLCDMVHGSWLSPSTAFGELLAVGLPSSQN